MINIYVRSRNEKRVRNDENNKYFEGQRLDIIEDIIKQINRRGEPLPVGFGG